MTKQLILDSEILDRIKHDIWQLKSIADNRVRSFDTIRQERGLLVAIDHHGPTITFYQYRVRFLELEFGADIDNLFSADKIDTIRYLYNRLQRIFKEQSIFLATEVLDKLNNPEHKARAAYIKQLAGWIDFIEQHRDYRSTDNE